MSIDKAGQLDQMAAARRKNTGMNTLKEQRILIVGGSSGIGFETAAAAQSAGASVTIASRSEPRLKASAAKLDGKVETAVLDTNDNAAIERFFAQDEPWDHIVISASQTKSGPGRGSIWVMRKPPWKVSFGALTASLALRALRTMVRLL
jgi:short-subunit dehydrogenase